MVNDTALLSLAERVGTPLYLYDLDRISQRVAALRDAVADAEVRYALKANANGALLRHLAGLGVGAEVITGGELERALRAGIAPEKLLLGGPRQDAPLIARAVELGVGLVSIDSAAQWRGWQAELRRSAAKVRFLIRVNPALDPRTHEHMATGAAESKFGVPADTAAELAAEIAARGQLAGFHIHAGSQIDAIEVYQEIFATLAPLYERFPDCDLLDIGGGFAVPDFPLARFAAEVARFTHRFGPITILEPGRYLVADAGVLLTRVLHVKNGPVRHVIADAGMAELLRPALYGARHPIRLVGRAAGPGLRGDVDGPLCENADRLGRDVELPEVAPGDLLAVEQAGAYGYEMASNYASSLRPAEVVLQRGEARLVRRRERTEDLWRLETDEPL